MNHSLDQQAPPHGAPQLAGEGSRAAAAERAHRDPISPADAASAPAAAADSASDTAGRRYRFRRQKNCPLIGLLAGTLKRMDFGKPARPADSRLAETGAPLAETQFGNDPRSKMTFHYTPGSQPLPRYTIRRGIGVGGFGEVYFAVSDAGKEVAIKRIQRNLEIELRGASQCLNLKHPNLVSLYDICRDHDDQSWVVMEYVAGKNLRQVLDLSPGGLPIAEVHRWFGSIAAGVAHLHSAGLVHRDIKPGNAFDDLGTVKVGDYGLSKFISASHRGGHTESVGTFHYMAPEIGRGRYGREIDIYALGVLLYELLTGRVPFDGESSHEIIIKHLTALPDLTGIGEPYRTVIARCLEKDPERRYRTVGELMKGLGLPLPEGTAGFTAGPVAWGAASAAGAAEAPHDPRLFVAAQLVGTTSEGARPQGGHGVSGGDAVAADSPEPGPSQADPLPLTPEPLARAVGAGVADFTRWWKSLDHSPLVKAALLVALIFFLILNSGWVIVALTLIGLFYVPYYVVRYLLLQSGQSPRPLVQPLAAVAPPPPPVVPPKPLSRKQWCQQMRGALGTKQALQRAAELHTSWIAAVMTVTGLTLAAGVFGLHDDPVTATGTAYFGWLGLVVLLSAVSILGLGKIWESADGEALPRRFVLAGLGAGVGAAAYGLQQYLLLPVEGVFRDVDASPLPPALYEGRIPTAGAMVAHFALLFGLLRWWKPVDPLRRRRLSVWSVAVAVGAAWAVHQVLPVAQPAGMLIAGGTSIAVQLSAPWIDRRAARLGPGSAACHRPTDPAHPQSLGSLA